jgi:hypothetical protein
MSIFLLDWDVVFVHTPKTGGTSIRHDCQVGVGQQFDPLDEWSDLPSFGFVRDPMDRALSAWKDFRFLRKMTAMGFEDFLRSFAVGSREDTIADPRTIEHHVAPMGHPVHGLAHAEFIGRYAHLQEDYDEFRATIELAPKALEFRRQSPEIDVAISPAVRKLVYQIYRSDYEQFGGYFD